MRFLTAELESARPLVPRGFDADPESVETLATFDMLREMGSESFGAYVISMARAPSDTLSLGLTAKRGLFPGRDPLSHPPRPRA